jgi:hypothetical protein
MLIGALIGLGIYSVIALVLMGLAQTKVDKHNQDRSRVILLGKAKVTVNYPQVAMSAVAFTTIGAIISYFI